MYSWMMKDALQQEWNNDAVNVPSSENEQFESDGKRLIIVRRY
jgi:hypothetical protein